MQYATTESFKNDDWVFSEEFLRKLAAAQVQHTQKLVKKVKDACGMANSAMMR